METKITRRAILGIGAAAGCAAVSGAIVGADNSKTASKSYPKLPWEWKKIDPEDIQERAYQSAWSKIACMYGTFESIMGTLADRHGAPYNTFPIEATLYGTGGIGANGSVCGTVNASGLLFSLFVDNQDDLFAICKEISIWYEKASLPVYKPKKPKVDIPIVQSVAGSTLCHVSSTRWANAAGYKVLTQEHFERCNRLVADVAKQIVIKLNEYSDGKIVFKEKVNSFSEGCLACHGPGGSVANVASSMSCDSCHENPH